MKTIDWTPVRPKRWGGKKPVEGVALSWSSGDGKVRVTIGPEVLEHLAIRLDRTPPHKLEFLCAPATDCKFALRRAVDATGYRVSTAAKNRISGRISLPFDRVPNWLIDRIHSSARRLVIEEFKVQQESGEPRLIVFDAAPRPPKAKPTRDG